MLNLAEGAGKHGARLGDGVSIDSPWSTRVIQWKAMSHLTGTGTGTGTLTGGAEFRNRP